MGNGQSLLSLFVIAIYLCTCVLCIIAATKTAGTRSTKLAACCWLLFAGAFAAFAVLRLSGLEDCLRTVFRQILRKDGIYELRRDVQAPLSVFAILCVTAITALSARLLLKTKAGSLKRYTAIAGFAVVSLCGLIVLRLISFHAIDAILFGPAKLNWIIDVGSSILTGWCAYRYTQALNIGRVWRS